MALEQYKTQVLLLHSEQGTLETLSSGFNDQYSIHLATSGTEALNIFTETPVHVIVSAQDLPGMSGLDALREAKKRSPDTVGILLVGNDADDGLEALVGDQEVFQIVRGQVTPQLLCALIESATKRSRLVTLSKSANDTVANVDQPVGANDAMGAVQSGAQTVSDISGTMPAQKVQKMSERANIGSKGVDLLVLTKDEEFLATIRDSSRGMHNVHHCVTPAQTEEIVRSRNVGVLVTDAAMVGSNIGVLTKRLRQKIPRLVAVVAGRRDDGELLMDLINRGEVYRFLLKPVSPGRSRLAIEAAVNHHMDAPDKAFKPASNQPHQAAPAPGAASGHSVRSRANAVAKARSRDPSHPKSTAAANRAPTTEPGTAITVSRHDSLLNDGFSGVFEDDNSLTQTMPGLAALIGQKITDLKETISPGSVNKQAESADESSGGADSSGQKWKIPAIAAAVAVAIAGVTWFALNAEVQTTTIGADSPVLLPTVLESDIMPTPATTLADDGLADPSGLLADARDALASGRLVSPPAKNAIELYVAAMAEEPDDSTISAELGSVVEQVFGMAESAILDREFEDAAQAIRVLQIANPKNPRLAFLTSQLSQQHVRSLLDDARLAIRGGRFEDAAAAIHEASIVSGTVTTELQAVSHELDAARSEQEIDEVLALANSRLVQDLVIQPANDNARYYYELALSNDANNIAARQGLKLVAGKLVLLARDAINDGHLTDAGDLLRIARSLDASSRELATVTTALMSAEAQAAADAIDEAERLAEQERIAEERLSAKVVIAGTAVATAAATGNAADRVPELQSGRTEITIDNRGFSESPVDEDIADAEVTRPAAVDTGSVNAEAENSIQGPAESERVDVGSEAIVAASVAFAALDNTPGAPGIDPGVQATPDAAGNRSGRAGKPAKPAEPAIVPVSSLTRLNYVAPKYPRSARRRNVTGSVDIGFTVTRDGTVTDIAILDSKPGNTFDDAAIDAVAAWRFEPAIEDGQRVEKKTAVRLAFALQ